MLSADQVSSLQAKYNLSPTAAAPAAPASNVPVNSAGSSAAAPTGAPDMAPAAPTNIPTRGGAPAAPSAPAAPATALPSWYTQLRSGGDTGPNLNGKSNDGQDVSSHPFNPRNQNSQFTQPTAKGATQMQYKPSDKTGFLQNLPSATGAAIKTTGQTYKKAVTDSADSLANAMVGNESPAAAGADTFSNFAKPTLDAYDKILSPVKYLEPTHYLNPLIDKLTGKNTEDRQAQDADQINQMYQVWAAKHPDAAKELHGVNSAVQVGMLVGGAEDVASSVKKGANTAMDTVKNTAEKINDKGQGLLDTIKNKGDKMELPKSQAQADRLAGQIGQATGPDVAKVQSALADVKVPKNATFEDVSNALDQKAKDLGKTRADALATNQGKTTLTQLDKTFQAGDKTITGNPVRSALDQLASHYEAIDQPADVARIKNLEITANKDGLTIKQIDDLAKEHGTQFGKNYKPTTGELKDTQSAAKLENTRSGLKTVVSNLFDDPAAKAVDQGISDTIRTKDLIDKQAKAAQQMANKLKDENFVQTLLRKGGTGLGKIINLVTGHGASGLIRGMAEVGGDGTPSLNILKLQDVLGSNIAEMQKFVSPETDASEAVKILEQMVKDNKLDTTELPKNKPAPEKGVTHQTKVEAADLGRKPLPQNIKVNNFDSPGLPQYKTSDLIKSEMERLSAKQQAGKSLDITKVKTKK